MSTSTTSSSPDPTRTTGRRTPPRQTDPDATIDLRILSGAHAFDLGSPLLTLSLDHPDSDTSNYLQAQVLDADDDGHLDIVAAQSSPDFMMQVWFGPLVDRLPGTEDTGHTAETGDTAAPSHTGSSPTDTSPSPTDDTAAPPEKEPPAEKPRCGCVSAVAPGSRWTHPMRRRRTEPTRPDAE